MAIKKVVTDELFNEYILEQLKPYINNKDLVLNDKITEETTTRITEDNKLAGSISGVATRVNNIETNKANDSAVVHKTGDETIKGKKCFEIGSGSGVYFIPSTNSDVYSIKIEGEGIYWNDYAGSDLGITWDSDYGGLRVGTSLHTTNDIYCDEEIKCDKTIHAQAFKTTGEKVKLDDSGLHFTTDDIYYTITPSSTRAALSITNGIQTENIYTDKIFDNQTEGDYRTVKDIFEAVDNTNKLKIYKWFTPTIGMIDSILNLPKYTTTFNIIALTAKGLPDGTGSTWVGSEENTSYECGPEGFRYTQLIFPSTGYQLFKTGYLKDIATEKYAYDRINLNYKTIERHVKRISLYELLISWNLTWSWTKSSGNGRLTISHETLKKTFPIESDYGFGYEKVDNGEGYLGILTPKGISTVNFAIDGWNELGTFSKFTDVKTYINSHRSDFQKCFVLFKLTNPQTEYLDNVDINNTFSNNSDSPAAKIINVYGQVQVSYFSTEELMYTKDQTDEKFVAKAYLDDKLIIKKLPDKIASSNLWSSIISSYITFAAFTSNDGSVPFIGPTLFIMQKEGSYNYLLAISNGSVYKWTGADTTQKNKLIQPYAARTYVFELEPSNWGSEKKQSFYFSELFEFEAAEADIMTTTPVSGYEQAYLDAGITRTFENDIITFSAETIPNDVIKVLLVYQKGEPLNITYTAIATTSEEDDAEEATEFDA